MENCSGIRGSDPLDDQMIVFMLCGEIDEVGFFWLITYNHCLSGQPVIGFVHQCEVQSLDKYRLKQDCLVG